MMRDYFKQICDRTVGALHSGEDCSLYLSAEDSDFTRLNHARIRQTGKVEQIYLNLEYVVDGKVLRQTMNLSGAIDTDFDQIMQLLNEMRDTKELVEADPFLDLAADSHIEVLHHPKSTLAHSELVDCLLAESAGSDLVGIVSHGALYRGYASPRNQFCWYETKTFNLDWSIYHSDDKAVKGSYAGLEWNSGELRDRLQADRSHLEYLSRPPKRLSPGAYRVYLAPAAVAEILSIVSWNGFSAKAQDSKVSCLHQLTNPEKSLSPKVNLWETTDLGMGVPFNESGLVKDKRHSLIEQGFLKTPLVSPRSAKQYGLASTAASTREVPEGLWLQPGILEQDSMLSELGTGIYISNLWYLNFSDRDSCRLTGMTRFASFWVENGHIAGPLDVMRFDESFFNLFGPQLIGFTSKADLILDPSTYGQRSCGGMMVPGALLGEMTFTL